MGLSGAEINKRIESLIATKTIYAQGLWYVMRRIIEHPENPREGYLWRDGRPVRAEEITEEPVNASPKAGPKALRALRSLVLKVKNTEPGPDGKRRPDVDYPLIKLDKAGCVYSPALIYLHERLRRKADEKAKSESRKERRGLRNPHDPGGRGLLAPEVTPLVPPDGFSLNNPSSLSPSSDFSGGAGEGLDPVDQLEGWELAGIVADLNHPDFRRAFAEWVLCQRARGDKLPAITVRRALGNMAKLGRQRAVAALNHSVANNYRGIIEPSASKRNGSNGHTARPPPSGPQPNVTIVDLKPPPRMDKP